MATSVVFQRVLPRHDRVTSVRRPRGASLHAPIVLQSTRRSRTHPTVHLRAWRELTPPTLRIARSMLVRISQSQKCGNPPTEWCRRPDVIDLQPFTGDSEKFQI